MLRLRFLGPLWVEHDGQAVSGLPQGMAIEVSYTAGGATIHVVDQPGEVTGDGRVDLADFAMFQICATRQPVAAESPCAAMDFDDSGHVDLDDYITFQAIFEGDERSR